MRIVSSINQESHRSDSVLESTMPKELRVRQQSYRVPLRRRTFAVREVSGIYPAANHGCGAFDIARGELDAFLVQDGNFIDCGQHMRRVVPIDGAIEKVA